MPESVRSACLLRKHTYAPNSPFNFGLTTGLQCMCNPGDNHYNSLQVQLDQRLSHGLNILGNYTYSHAKNHDSPDFLYDPVSRVRTPLMAAEPEHYCVHDLRAAIREGKGAGRAMRRPH